MYSVVIPVYQAEDTLERCVRSWLAQTEADLELILVDDGSRDGSGALCDAFAKEDRRIRVIHQQNAGVSAARNAGIAAANGDFVLFTDSDDYVSPEYLQKMKEVQLSADSDLVLCGFHHLYDGADIHKIPECPGTFELESFKEPFLMLYEKSYLNMPWNKLYRRDRMGTFNPSLSLGEDLLFNLDYLGNCERISVIAEPLCYYIQEGAGTATLSSRKRENRLELARRVCRETEEFYERTWQEMDCTGRIFTRYLNEVLDECEKLPADRNLSWKEKRRTIHAYAGDEWVQSRGMEAKLELPDYRLIWAFLRRDLPTAVYVLCALRYAVVRLVHRLRRRRAL